VQLSRSELEELWVKHIGSRDLSVEQEIELLSALRRGNEVNWKIVYRLYLTSKYWKQIQRKVLDRDGWACVQCKSKAFVQVDHIKYRPFGWETPEILQTLCYECHAAKTKGFKLTGGAGPGVWKVDVSGHMFGALRRQAKRPEEGDATARI
jgi:5-methylcytosine-specific restriction endonuclease McrA